jgi:hypothetical protein
MNHTSPSLDLEQRIRHSLHTVAEAAITGDGRTALTAATSAASKPRRRKRLLLVGGVVAVPLALAAGAVMRTGSEYVSPIPDERIVMEGQVDGSHYLLAKSDRTNKCGEPTTGVELVAQDRNLFGQEWNTTGTAYGESKWLPECGDEGVDTARYLRNPALYNEGGAKVGDSFVWVYAVHPDVDTIRVTSGDYAKRLPVYHVDGAGYAAFEVPQELDEYITELVIDDAVIPGSRKVQKVPDL